MGRRVAGVGTGIAFDGTNFGAMAYDGIHHALYVCNNGSDVGTVDLTTTTSFTTTMHTTTTAPAAAAKAVATTPVFTG